MIKPPRLQIGSTIGIVSPARWMSEDELARGKAELERLGFRVVLSPQNAKRDRQFAGTDLDRAKAVEDMFADPGIDAVMCSKGGYGTMRIIDLVDYDVIRSNPKILIGYSDVTALLLESLSESGVVPFHGPMLHSFVKRHDALTEASFRAVLCDAEAWSVEYGAGSQVRTLRPGKGSGPLIGGNVSILTHMIGTKNDFDTDGAVFFIEDVDEYLYGFERMMLHLKRAGKLQRLSALIVGDMVDMRDNPLPFGRTTDEIVLEMCHGTDFPIIANFPCGHGSNSLTLPLMIPAEVEARTSGVSFRLLEPAVA